MRNGYLSGLIFRSLWNRAFGLRRTAQPPNRGSCDVSARWDGLKGIDTIAIACKAFACVRHLTNRIALQQRERMSPERIRQARAARQCSIDRNAKSGLPSKTTSEIEHICRTLRLPLSRKPQWIE